MLVLLCALFLGLLYMQVRKLRVCRLLGMCVCASHQFDSPLTSPVPDPSMPDVTTITHTRTRTHAPMYARTNARTPARTHARTHVQIEGEECSDCQWMSAGEPEQAFTGCSDSVTKKCVFAGGARERACVCVRACVRVR